MELEQSKVFHVIRELSVQTRRTVFVAAYLSWAKLSESPDSTFVERERAWNSYVEARESYLKCPNPDAPLFDA